MLSNKPSVPQMIRSLSWTLKWVTTASDGLKSIKNVTIREFLCCLVCIHCQLIYSNHLHLSNYLSIYPSHPFHQTSLPVTMRNRLAIHNFFHTYLCWTIPTKILLFTFENYLTISKNTKPTVSQICCLKQPTFLFQNSQRNCATP